MIATCPPDETLRRYLLGDFSDGEGSELESHLAECSACEETLSRFDDTHDSLLRHLPLAAGSSVDLPTQVSPWLERLMQGPPPPRENDGQPAEEPAAGLVIEGLENYELTGVLGKGGMGVVYRAVHRQLNRPVAIKVIRPKLFSAAEARQRFAREIQILGGLNHPGIVAATDAGKIGPAAYLVMELIDGVDFSRLVHRSGPLAIGEGCEVARQIAAALAAVHDAGAIHRDIKPSNVMLDRAGRVKLLDFGLAHLAEPERDHPETSMGRLLGTLDYMAPEQADGDSVGTAADLYAIGATLYFLLTGRPPRGGEGQQTLLQQLKSLVQNEITPLSAARADVPPELSELVTQLLAKDPTNRPRSAQEVAQRLAAWADRESVEQLCDRVPPNAEPEEGASASQSISQSLTELLGSQLAAQVEPHIEPAPAPKTPLPLPKSRFRRVGGTLIALALVAAALWAGFTLLIETPSGTIRIESDVAGVQVELLDEQEQTKTLEIKQGENRSELKAGRYRILIAGGHDHLSVTPDEITLQRGEERVARITQVDAEGKVVPTDAQGQPLYQGEPLEVWQQRFDSETDPLAKIKVGQALITLARPLPELERFDTVMKIGSELLESGWGASGAIKSIVRHQNAMGYEFHAPRWPASSAEAIEKSWGALRESIELQLESIPPEKLAQWLTKRVAEGEGLEPHFVLFLLQNTRVGYLTEGIRIVRDNRSASEQIVLNLRPGDGQSTEARHLREAALLVRTLYDASVTEEAQQQLREEMVAQGKEMLEPDFVPVSMHFVRAWGWQARQLKLDPRLSTEVAFAGLVGKSNVVPIEIVLANSSGSSPWPRSRYGQPWTSGQELFRHWGPVAMDWLRKQSPLEEASAEEQEIRARVLTSLDTTLRFRRVTDDWDPSELAQVLVERFPSSVLRDTVVLLCDADLPESSRQPPGSEEVQQRLETLRQLLGAGATQYQNGRAQLEGLFDQAPYATLQLMIEADQLPEGISPLRVVWDTLQVDASGNPFGHGFQVRDVEPLLLLAIAAELAGKSPAHDERILQFFNPDEQLSLSGALQIGLKSDGAISQTITRHLRRMKEKAKSEKLREAIDKLVPGLGEAPPSVADSQDKPAMDAEEKPTPKPAEGDHSGPEALYQGEPISVWQRRFEAETDPLAKIEAGKALVSLARPLPPEERFARIMWVGGQLVRDGWNTPALKLNSLRDVSLPPNYLPPTSWPSDARRTVSREFEALRSLSASQLAAEEPVALAARFRDHFAHADLNEAWFVVHMIGLQEPLYRSQPAADIIVGQLLHPEDKNLNRVALLRGAWFFPHASESAQADYARMLSIMGKKLAEEGLPAEEAWVAESWSNAAQVAGVEPKIRAEVAFRQLIDHGTAPTTFDISPDENRSNLPAAIQMAEHWIHLTNRWLEDHKAQADSERLASVINALTAPLRIRPIQSKWEIDRTKELAAALLQDLYETPPGRRNPGLEPHQLLTQIILCGGEIPDFAKQPPSGGELLQRLEAFRRIAEGPALDPENNPTFGVMFDAPFMTMEILTAPVESSQNRRTSSEFEAIIRTAIILTITPRQHPLGPSTREWKQVDSLMILAILGELSGKSQDRDDEIALLFQEQLRFTGIHPPVSVDLQSEFATRPIAEQYLRTIKQKTESENLLAAIEKFAPGLEASPETEEVPKDEPAIEAEEKPAPQPAEVDHSGPEALYQGEPLSVWQRRFEAETDPLAKINVGQALITLARPLPERERFDTVMKVGSELLEDGWGADGVIQWLVRNQSGIGYGFQAPRWPASSAEALEKSWGRLRESIEIQLQPIPPRDLAELLTKRVAEGERLEPHLIVLLLQISRGGMFTKLDQAASEHIARELRPGGEDSANARHFREAALLVRTLLHASVSEEAQQQLRAEMIALGQRMIEADYLPISGDFVHAWRRQAQQLKLDPRLHTEVAFAGLVGNWNVLPHEIFNMMSSGATAGMGSRFRHQLAEGQDLFRHWAPVATDWLQQQSPWEEATAEEQEIRDLVLKTLETVLRYRKVTDDWKPEELAQVLDERFPPSMRRDTAILLCNADLPESSRQPPQSEDVQRQLETLQELLGGSATQYQSERARLAELFDQAPYATLQVIIESEQLPNGILPLRVVWDTLQTEAALNQGGFGHGSQLVEPLLLLAIATDLTGKSESHDERILQLFYLEGFGTANPLNLRDPLERSLKSEFAISQAITRHFRKMQQKTKSEKLRQVIEKLAPGLEADAEVEDKDFLSMQEAAELLNQQSAEARADLFNPPIEKLSAERLREGFAETAKVYRERDQHAIADTLQKIAESGQVPRELHLMSSGVISRDDSGETVTQQIVPAIFPPNPEAGADRILVLLRSIELIYNRDGASSVDYGEFPEEPEEPKTEEGSATDMVE